ncbi:hypothetical protein [Georgenia satyanarayanai]|uniref:hypothetical protein n=1 Tax=Georgenia satyanarayanai TaxID=860221 RepID=UPI001264FBE8|nr:hypothetical protein [Georgenia satyanarayanai]
MRASDRGAPSSEDTAGSAGVKASGRGGRLGWIGLAVAAVLAAWQVVYAIAEPASTNPEVLTSVWLLLTLVLAVGAVVLGIVALGQRAVPRWPATAALAVGVYAFVVSVASWIGGLMG